MSSFCRHSKHEEAFVSLMLVNCEDVSNDYFLINWLVVWVKNVRNVRKLWFIIIIIIKSFPKPKPKMSTS